MTDPRNIIAKALFDYHYPKVGTSRKDTVYLWGFEHSEARADAVLEALATNGWHLSKDD